MPLFEAKLSDGRTVTVESDKKPTNEQILNAVGGQQPERKSFSQFAELDKKLGSPLNVGERAMLSFADDDGKEEFLRKKFDFVRRDPQKGFMVGSSPTDLEPIDPAGIEGDFLGDIADGTSLIPVIAGQIIGSIAGAPAGPGGIVGGGALGAGTGEAFSKLIGKGLGVNEQKAEEMATDIVISSGFGAVGEGLGLALKGVGPTVARKTGRALSRMLKAKSGVPAEQSKMIGTIAKTFDIASNVKPQATVNVFKYGDEAVFTPKNLNKANSITVAKNVVDDIASAGKVLGNKQGEALKAIGGRINKRTVPITDDVFRFQQELIEEGILNPDRTINKNLITKAGDRTIINGIFKQLPFKASKTGASETVTISPKELLSLQNQLSLRFESLLPKHQRLFTIFRQGLGNKLDAWASSIKTPSGRNFLNARAGVANFRQQLDKLELAGFKADNEFAVENFIRSYFTKSPGAVEAINNIDKLTHLPILKNIETFATAQQFLDAKPNLLRLGAVASLIGAGKAESQEEKLGFLGLSVLIGSPAGNRLLLQSAFKGGRVPRKAALQVARNAAKLKTSQVDKASAKVLLQALAGNLKTTKKDKRDDNR